MDMAHQIVVGIPENEQQNNGRNSLPIRIKAKKGLACATIEVFLDKLSQNSGHSAKDKVPEHHTVQWRFEAKHSDQHVRLFVSREYVLSGEVVNRGNEEEPFECANLLERLPQEGWGPSGPARYREPAAVCVTNIVYPVRGFNS